MSDIIINNFYTILKNYEYYSIKNYFMLKNFIFGHGKYGTVWFGIDLKKAKPIAIKVINEEKRNIFLHTEFIMMKKLSKFKIFTKVYDEINLLNNIYLIETLQGPALSKIRKFYGKKFSTITVYKIGIEILRCLKLIHKSGYLYIDLKENNISILFKPITQQKKINNLTLIDYGFCEKYNKDKNKSPKIHGHSSYASINSLKKNAISRKDDLIALCYFLVDLINGSLPWDDISNEDSKYNKIITLKEDYSFKKICNKDAKELAFIFDSSNCLGFNEVPDYDNYSYLLENYIKIKTGKVENEILFDWENKIIEDIKSYDGIENYIKKSNEISNLFKGYPNFCIKYFLERYINKK